MPDQQSASELASQLVSEVEAETVPRDYAALVEAWFDRNFRKPAITHSVEAWNVCQEAKADLIATLKAGG